MRGTYISHIDETLKEYIQDLIEANPQEFATDGANNRLVNRYFKDVYNIDVHNYIATKVHSITRIKSKYLADNPHLDKRIKEAGKKTSTVTVDEEVVSEQDT